MNPVWPLISSGYKTSGKMMRRFSTKQRWYSPISRNPHCPITPTVHFNLISDVNVYGWKCEKKRCLLLGDFPLVFYKKIVKCNLKKIFSIVILDNYRPKKGARVSSYKFLNLSYVLRIRKYSLMGRSSVTDNFASGFRVQSIGISLFSIPS